jgi:hypothetical protein
MRTLLWLVPVAFFFLNPGVGCGSDEPQFDYGATEMRAAIEGDWSFTITSDAGAVTQVTVHVDQASATSGAAARAPGRALVRAAYACGTRTLVKSAQACVDVTEMPLAVTYVSGDDAFATAALSGTFGVVGLSFAYGGDLVLNIGPYQIVSQVKPDRSLVDLRLGPGGQTGTVIVSRS